MSLAESSATALIRFTGLGFVCFNEPARRGEIAAIRDDKHTLNIRIQRPVYLEGGNDVIAYQDVVTYDNLPKADVRLEIKASGSPAVQGFEIYKPGEFDRLDSPDPNDFRWIVNMNSLHGGAPLVTTAEQRYPLTKIYIANGLFYTHKLDTSLFFESIAKDASGETRKREVFGNVGETIGVKIEAEEVSFTINVAGREETHSLKRVEGLPFRIEIRNMDHSGSAVYSDMPDYYKYVASAAGDRFELSPIIEAGGNESVNTVEFCHPIEIDPPGGSIDNL
jgi:hypothetical protein